MEQERFKSQQSKRPQMPTKYLGSIGRARFAFDYTWRVIAIYRHFLRTGESALPPENHR